jgi:hypothetical protein
MALFGSSRDVLFFKGTSREILNRIVSTQVGYYKVMLSDTPTNVYGEGVSKYYIGPVLMNCLISRGDYSSTKEDYGPEVKRDVEFRFLRDDLVEANVYPEIGDVIMYNESYYAVDNVNENQLILGKDNSYSYSQGLEVYGASYSIILSTHYTSPDALGITEQRL